MTPDPDKIRALAEATAHYASDAFGWSLDSHGSTARELEQTLTAVWPKVFPPEPPAEGSVKVRIMCDWKQREHGPVGTLNFVDAEIAHATAIAAPTHRAIIEAWLPPIQPIPTVPGTVETKGGSDVN